MDAFELDDLLGRREAAAEPWLEFFRMPAMSLGLYVLAAGAEDPQGPHPEDEAYVVLAGRARVRVAGLDRPVGPGSIVVVERGVEHRFHAIEEELRLLVVFAPAYTGRG